MDFGVPYEERGVRREVGVRLLPLTARGPRLEEGGQRA
jgi:hypothetical protein